MKSVKIFPTGLLWLFIIFFSLGQLQRVVLPGGIHFYVHDIIIMIWLSAFLWQEKLSLQKMPAYLTSVASTIRKNKLETLFLLWAGVGMILAVLQTGAVVPLLYAGRVGLYGAFAVGLRAVYKQMELDLRMTWLVGGLLVLVLGLVQYVFLPDTRFLMSLGWDDHYYRLIGTMLDPAFAGMMLVLTFIYLWFWPPEPRSEHIRHLLLSVLTAGVAMTFSRASYVSFIASLVIISVLTWRKKEPVFKLGLYGVLLFLTIFLLPKPTGEGIILTRTSTISARVGINESVLKSLNTQELIVGRGLFTTRNLFVTAPIQDTIPNQARFPDNLFVMILSSMGVPGLLLFIGLLIRWEVVLFNRDHAIFIAFNAIILHSQFNHTLLQPFVLLMFLGGLASSTQWKKIRG